MRATCVEFVYFGDGIFGGVYYDTQRIEDAVKPESLLAYEMNDVPLPQIHGSRGTTQRRFDRMH